MEGSSNGCIPSWKVFPAEVTYAGMLDLDAVKKKWRTVKRAVSL